MNDRCERCRFFRIVQVNVGPDITECHRRSEPDPGFVDDPMKQFRPVSEDNWCGQFKLRSRRLSSTPERIRLLT